MNAAPGLAASSVGDVVAAGSARTTPLDEPPRYDAMTWGYPHGYPFDAQRWADVFETPDTDPKPDPENELSERARAVLVLPDGRFAVLGERDYPGDDNFLYTRAVVLRFSADGAYLGQWTSDGSKFANDAALAGTATATGFVLAGACRHKGPNATQQTCIQTFDAALDKIYVEPGPTQSAGLGIAEDREKRLVVAGYTTKPGQTDAWLFASRSAGDPLAWQQGFDQGGWDFAADVVCEPWGKCTWIGATTKNGKLTLVASQRYP